MIVGKFSRTSDGWSGAIQTLTIYTKLRLVPNDKRENERVPDFRVVSGQFELGVAWRRARHDTSTREHYGVMLDGPLIAEPLNLTLLETTRPGEANLIWTRQQRSRFDHEELGLTKCSGPTIGFYRDLDLGHRMVSGRIEYCALVAKESAALLVARLSEPTKPRHLSCAGQPVIPKIFSARTDNIGRKMVSQYA